MKLRLFAMAMGMLAVNAYAGEGVGVRAGTTGVGADFAFGLMPTLAARIGYSAFDLNRNVNDNGASYNGRLKLSNFSALLDWSPIGPFRISAGLVADNNRISLTAQPQSGNYTLNGTSYSAAELSSVNGSVKGKNSVAPYIGIGYGNIASLGVNFYTDIGVILQGGARSSISATCGPSAPQGSAICNQIQSNVAGEQSNINSSVSGFKVWPVANIGITIGF